MIFTLIGIVGLAFVLAAMRPNEVQQRAYIPIPVERRKPK